MRNPESALKNRSALGEAIRAAYRAGQEDEALEPIIRVDSAGRPIGRIGRNDSVIFYDIRGEREIEITESLTDPAFPHFPVEPDLRLRFVTMIEYDPKLKFQAAFAKEEKIVNTLAEVVSRAGLRLVKVAGVGKGGPYRLFYERQKRRHLSRRRADDRSLAPGYREL